MLTQDFDYDLPQELIAQEPAYPRDSCRLLVLHRSTGQIEHRVFSDIIDYLDPGDLLVVNETRVMPARLLGRKEGTGGAAELLLLTQRQPGELDASQRQRIRQELGVDLEALVPNKQTLWECLVKPGKRLKPGAKVLFQANTATAAALADPDQPLLRATILDWVAGGSSGQRLVLLDALVGETQDLLEEVGDTPLPPYITDYQGDKGMYQTVYARTTRSAAAPTAGLHFTEELLQRIKDKGVGLAKVDLEVGLDTFRIVTEEHPEDHSMHTERYTVPLQTVEAIQGTKARGGRVIAVGTTSTRSLESAWDVGEGQLLPRDRESTSLFLLPGSTFHVVDGLITNFHVPKSTLMMLVSAFASTQQIRDAYAEAISQKYRMLSFGDAMYIE